MKILIIGDPHGNLRYPKSVLKQAEIIFITGDIGKADLTRKRFFENAKRRKKGLSELESTKEQEKAIHMENHNSTIKFLRELSKYAPIYTIEGNVGIPKKTNVNEIEKEHKIKLPVTKEYVSKIKDVNIIKNEIRRIGNLRVGFLEYFIDNSYIKEFKIKYFEERLRGKKESLKAKKILKWFGKVDILVCHQPPYGYLDKINFQGVPKDWLGKHAGSKIILDYIKKYQPRYVFCGHIHEGKGKSKIGKTEVYNVGFNGDYLLMDIK